MGIEALGGAPPVMLGIAVILWALWLCVPAWVDAYIRVRTFHDSRPHDLRLVASDEHGHKAIGPNLDPPQPEQTVPLAG